MIIRRHLRVRAPTWQLTPTIRPLKLARMRDTVSTRPAFETRAPKIGFSPALDGLRAIPLMMVLFVHAAYETFGAFAGSVDMFFVVSGFLITTLIFEEYRKSDRIDFRQFYLRRALRLFPALYTTLVATLIAAAAVGDAKLLRMAWNDTWSAFLYVYHVIHPVHQEVVAGGAPEIRPLVHLWSLSVEEHFYLVAAVGLAFVIRRRLVVPLAIAFTAIWVAVSLARLGGHVGPRFMWYQRPDSLLVGVVAAVIHATMPPSLGPVGSARMRRAGVGASVTLVLVVWLGTKFAKPFGLFVPFIPMKGESLSTGLYWGEFGFSIVAVCTATIVMSVVRCPDAPLARWLSWKPLQAIGRRSYVLYLVHVPLFVVLLEIFGEKPIVPLSYLVLYPTLSELIHRRIEKPALKLRHRFQAPGASGI